MTEDINKVLLILNSALLGILTTLFFYIYRKVIDSLIIQRGVEVNIESINDNFEKTKRQFIDNIKNIKTDLRSLEYKVDNLDKDVAIIKSKINIKKEVN